MTKTPLLKKDNMMPHSVGGTMKCGVRADYPGQSLLDSMCSVNAHFPPFSKAALPEKPLGTFS